MVRAGLSALYIFSHLILRKILLRQVVASPLNRNGSERFTTCPRHTASEGTPDFKTQDPGSTAYAVAKFLHVWGYCAKRQAFVGECCLMTQLVTWGIEGDLEQQLFTEGIWCASPSSEGSTCESWGRRHSLRPSYLNLYHHPMLMSVCSPNSQLSEEK